MGGFYVTIRTNPTYRASWQIDAFVFAEANAEPIYIKNGRTFGAVDTTWLCGFYSNSITGSNVCWYWLVFIRPVTAPSLCRSKRPRSWIGAFGTLRVAWMGSFMRERIWSQRPPQTTRACGRSLTREPLWRFAKEPVTKDHDGCSSWSSSAFRWQRFACSTENENRIHIANYEEPSKVALLRSTPLLDSLLESRDFNITHLFRNLSRHVQEFGGAVVIPFAPGLSI